MYVRPFRVAEVVLALRRVQRVAGASFANGNGRLREGSTPDVLVDDTRRTGIATDEERDHAM